MLVIPSNLNLQVQFDLGAWLWVWGTWLPTWALLWAARATDSTALDDQSAMLIHFSWFYFENVRSTPNLRLQVTYLYSTPTTNSIYIYIFICIYTYIYIAYIHIYAHKHDIIYLILVLWTYITSSTFRTDSGSLGCSSAEPQRNMFWKSLPLSASSTGHGGTSGATDYCLCSFWGSERIPYSQCLDEHVIGTME
jgi:hypothetical protein